MFDKVKVKYGINQILEKLKIISGDLMQLQLGISPENLKILTEEVSIIYSFGAKIRFDEKLSTSLITNTRGTYELIQIARKCKNLEVSLFNNYNFLQE